MKKIRLYLYKSGKRLEFRPHQRTIYDAWTSKLEEDDTVSMQLAKHRPHKTNAQLSYWYGVLIPHTVDALREAGHNSIFDVSVGEFEVGVDTDADSVDLLLKVLFKAHKQLDKLPLKRDMSTEEMSLLIDWALNWVAENLSIYIPTPERIE